jgi:adenylate cyclase
MIRMGDVVALEAAIWFSDLRGFTGWSQGIAPEQTIERLNAYFETVGKPIYAAGGEILKYIGDAILAVFPVGEVGGFSNACNAAMLALTEVQKGLAELNRQREARGEPGFSHGVGLHAGSVGYGNIGSRERLDFTVIGEAVNLASRIEGMCSTLNQPVLCSAAFAEFVEAPTRSIGDHVLKGITRPVSLCTFIPPDGESQKPD